MYHPLFTVKNFQHAFDVCPFPSAPRPSLFAFLSLAFPLLFLPLSFLSASFSLCISLFAFPILVCRLFPLHFALCFSRFCLPPFPSSTPLGSFLFAFLAFHARPFLFCIPSFASSATLCSLFCLSLFTFRLFPPLAPLCSFLFAFLSLSFAHALFSLVSVLLLRRRPSAPFLPFLLFASSHRSRPFLSCFPPLPLLSCFPPFPSLSCFSPLRCPPLRGHSRTDARERSAFGNARRTGADVGAQGQTSTAYT